MEYPTPWQTSIRQNNEFELSVNFEPVFKEESEIKSIVESLRYLIGHCYESPELIRRFEEFIPTYRDIIENFILKDIVHCQNKPHDYLSEILKLVEVEYQSILTCEDPKMKKNILHSLFCTIGEVERYAWDKRREFLMDISTKIKEMRIEHSSTQLTKELVLDPIQLIYKKLLTIKIIQNKKQINLLVDEIETRIEAGFIKPKITLSNGFSASDHYHSKILLNVLDGLKKMVFSVDYDFDFKVKKFTEFLKILSDSSIYNLSCE